MSADGVDQLCRLLYDRRAEPRDYLGGSDARILTDAAAAIRRCRAAALECERELDAARRLAGRARRVLETCGRLPGVHADAADCPCEACGLVREIPVEWEVTDTP